MAEKAEVKVIKEMVYTVPLKYAWLGPHNDRTRKAVDILKKFMFRHMKAREVKLAQELNEFIWSRGMKNPPRKVKVRAVKVEDGAVWLTLPDKKLWFEIKPEKKEEATEKKQKEKEEVGHDKQQADVNQKEKKSADIKDEKANENKEQAVKKSEKKARVKTEKKSKKAKAKPASKTQNDRKSKPA